MNADEVAKLRAEVEELHKVAPPPEEARALRRERRLAKDRARMAERNKRACPMCQAASDEKGVFSPGHDHDFPCARCGRPARPARSSVHWAITDAIVAHPEGKWPTLGVASMVAPFTERPISRRLLLSALHSDPRFRRHPGPSQFAGDEWEWGVESRIVGQLGRLEGDDEVKAAEELLDGERTWEAWDRLRAWVRTLP